MNLAGKIFMWFIAIFFSVITIIMIYMIFFYDKPQIKCNPNCCPYIIENQKDSNRSGMNFIIRRHIFKQAY